MNQLVGEHIAVVFPGVIGLGVSLPLNQVLENPPFPKMAVVSDGLDFVFFFPVDDVWGWSREVGSVLSCLLIQGQKAGVEDVMYCP